MIAPALFTFGLGSPLLESLGLGGEAAFVAAYTLSGPSTATTGILSDSFAVELAAGTLADPVDVTPSDGGAGGSFTVAFVILSDSTRLALFRYTPAAAGTVTISVTNDGGLTDPAPLTLTVSDPVPFDPDATGHGPIVMLRPAPGRWFHRGR